MGLNPTGSGVVEDGCDPQGFEHLGESRILVQAQGLGATESVNGITVVGKQGDRLAAEVQMPLLQPEQGGLQFEFVTPGHRNSARGDQRVAVRSRDLDSTGRCNGLVKSFSGCCVV